MRKFKKSLAVVLLSASLVAVASCTKTNSEVNPTPINDIIDPFLTGTDVFIGDTVTITPREIEKDGKYYPCYDFYTITPDGNRLSGEKQYISVAGEYETVFLAKLEDGSFIADSDTFIAYEKAFNVEKEDSFTQYTDKILGDFEHTTPGITAKLADGDTWHYNQIIDISGSSLTKPIIKFYSSPMSEFLNGDVSPYIDATKQILRISDYYDPTNYIDVQIGYFLANQSTGRMQTYSVAGASNQTATGLMPGQHVWGTRRLVNIDKTDYTCCFGFDDFGADMNTVPGTYGYKDPEHLHPFSPDITNSDKFGYSVYYIESSKRIYIQHRDLLFISDLDEPLVYNDNVFKGFTTGEVTLSLRFDGYQSSSATFEIAEIYGKKGEELKEMKAIDEKAPIIYVDCKKDNFYIARNEEFSVPLATASDAHLKGDVEVEVIYDKGSSSQRYITVTDGKFTPTEVGEYTIVYTAHDAFNNVSTKEIKCQAINCEDNKLVDFDYTKITATDAGTEITISKPTISSANGEDGLYANLYIVDPNGEQTKYDALENDSISYLLKRVGKYKIIYEYGDIAKSYVEQYDFDSQASENIYLETAVFPKYFIKDSKVTIDDNRAILCDSADVHYIDTTIQAKFDTGEYETITDINNFEIKGNSTVMFKYLNGNEQIYESESIPIVDVGFTGDLNLNKYFSYFGETWSTELWSNFIELRNKGYADKIDFINPLSFASFSTKFKFLSRDQFDKFSLILTDYYDSNNVVSFDFVYRSSNLYLTYEDVSVSLGDTDTITLSYDYISSSLSYGPSSFHMDNPFTKDRYYLSFKFDNPKTNAVIQLFSLCNQQFKKNAKDATPVIAFNNLTGYYSLGDIIEINETRVCDVLSPYLKDKHQLLVEYQTDVDADPEIVKSIDNISLDGNEDADRDYVVKLDKYGIYTLTYSYTDQATKKSTYNQDVIHVIDDKAPVITIEGATSSTIDTCGFNADVKVRNISIEDENLCTTTIYVISPTDVLTKVEKDTFKANEKGLWKVVYYVVDIYGNIGSAYYQVKCQ